MEQNLACASLEADTRGAARLSAHLQRLNSRESAAQTFKSYVVLRKQRAWLYSQSPYKGSA